MAEQTWGEFSSNCAHKMEPDWHPLRRPVNGLNLESGFIQMDRCIMQPPVNVAGVAADAFRWLGSGGSELAFGQCCKWDCPLRKLRQQKAENETHQPATS